LALSSISSIILMQLAQLYLFAISPPSFLSTIIHDHCIKLKEVLLSFPDYRIVQTLRLSWSQLGLCTDAFALIFQVRNFSESLEMAR
jgi:hypothetical protein